MTASSAGVVRPETACPKMSGRDEQAPSRPGLLAALLTPLVLLIHGFHPFAGDAGIYVAGIRHLLDPSLYPLNAAFVTAFTRLSVFAWAIAGAVRLLHIPVGWALLAAQLASIWLWLTACRRLSARIFPSATAPRCSILLAAALFTLPVAGTALFLMDPYVTSRSFSAPLALLALCACMDRAWGRTALLLAAAIALHPLMGTYAAACVIVYALVSAGRIGTALMLCLGAVLAAGVAFALSVHTPISPAYRQAVSLEPRSFLFLARWQWFEDLGLVLPLVLFALALRGTSTGPAAKALCRTAILLGSTSVLIAAAFVRPHGPYPLVPLQVLRSFHLIYAVGVVLSGGLLGGLLRRSRIASGILVLLLFAGMFAAQRLSWPGSRHIEWPGATPASPWQQAFLWIRSNTPRDAVFAFDPKLVYLPAEDEQGFRAIAERDQLADDKDAGVAAVIPGLSDRWALQRNAELHIDQMPDAERAATLTLLGANWILLPPDASTALPCPWRNRVVSVCRLR